MDVKKRKIIEGQSTGSEEDMISTLHDSIIAHILSFLNTKEAVATSILSRRWRYQWTSISSLDFVYPVRHFTSNPERARKFMNSVERVLLHRGTSNIRDFFLICNEECDTSRINAWISTVIGCQVEGLLLYLYVRDPFVLPRSLFTCETLKELKLSLCEGTLKLPSSACLPNLKILELRFIEFPGEDLTKQFFFRSCPVLEDLCLYACNWKNLKVIHICSPTLKVLAMENSAYPPRGSNLGDCMIKINAPMLKFLCYKCISLPKDLVLSTSPSLDEADISLETSMEDSVPEYEKISWAIRLLRGLSNVKVLKIPAIILETEDLLDHLPKFDKLKELDVTMNVNYRAARGLSHLLGLAPNLESLIFNDGLMGSSSDEVSWILDYVPESFLLHLAEVEFNEFEGNDLELDMVKYLFDKAAVLDSVRIECSDSLYDNQKQKMDVMAKLLKIRRRSNATLNFD